LPNTVSHVSNLNCHLEHLDQIPALQNTTSKR
jgi:hypothetical protein